MRDVSLDWDELRLELGYLAGERAHLVLEVGGHVLFSADATLVAVADDVGFGQDAIALSLHGGVERIELFIDRDRIEQATSGDRGVHIGLSDAVTLGVSARGRTSRLQRACAEVDVLLGAPWSRHLGQSLREWQLRCSAESARLAEPFGHPWNALAARIADALAAHPDLPTDVDT
jgi:hypothetical protein